MKPQKPPRCYFFYTFFCFHEILSKVENIWLSNDHTVIRQSAGITERWKFSTIYQFLTNLKTTLYFQLVYYFEIGRWLKISVALVFLQTVVRNYDRTKPTCFGLQIFIYPRLSFFGKCFVTSLIDKKCLMGLHKGFANFVSPLKFSLQMF